MNKKWIQHFSVFILLTGLFFGCATMGISGEDEFQTVIRLISSGESAALAEATRLPFLLDGEILLGETESLLLWEGLASARVCFS